LLTFQVSTESVKKQKFAGQTLLADVGIVEKNVRATNKLPPRTATLKAHDLAATFLATPTLVARLFVKKFTFFELLMPLISYAQAGGKSRPPLAADSVGGAGEPTMCVEFRDSRWCGQ
jgi:hypothetical protein